MLAHNHNSGSRQFLAKNGSRLESTHPRHADVKKDDIGPEFGGALNGLSSIFRFAADFPTGPRREDNPDAAAHGLAVIRDENSHGLSVYTPRTRDYHSMI